MSTMLKASLRLVIECCALYLLSVALLLLGVFWAMSSPLLGGAGLVGDLPLLGIMTGYDVALLGVLGYLFAKPERREDGYYVAMAALLLAMDPTFFNNRILGNGGWSGVAWNAGLLMLGIVKVLTMAGICRVPIPRGTVVSVLVVQVLVWLGPAPFVLEEFGAGSGWLYALAWSPLLLAFLAPCDEELAADPDDPTEVASVRAREFRLVAVLLPFVGLGIHLYEIAAVYGLDLGWHHASPWFLALGTMLVRAFPEDVEDLETLAGLLAMGAIGASLTGPDSLLTGAPFALTPLRVTLVANFLVGAYLTLRFDRTSHRVFTVTMGLVAASGGSMEEICTAFAGPYGWASFTLASATAFSRYPGFWPAAASWVGLVGLGGSLATGMAITIPTVHLAGLGLITLGHVYQEEEEDLDGLLTLLTWGLLANAVVHRAGPTRWILPVEGLGVAIGAMATTRLRYRIPAGIGLGWALFRSSLGTFLIQHRAPLGLGGAFVCLGAGLAASANKEELLARLEEPEEDESPPAPEGPELELVSPA